MMGRMMNVSVDTINTCSRRYGSFVVVYDLRCKVLLRLDDIAADVWDYVVGSGVVSLEDISCFVAGNYDCEIEDVRDDMRDFALELYEAGVLLIDGKPVDQFFVGNDAIIEDDAEGEIISELGDLGYLYSATIELTYACNEKCVHCYANIPGQASNPVHISVDDYKRIIDELRTMGCMHLAFTGGDPFMHPDFLEIYEYARLKGFVCDIYTNGLYLDSSEEAFSRIAKLKPRAFYISLYGSCAQTHDSVTLVPGSYDRTVSVVKRLVDGGIPVVLNMMILSMNSHQVDGMVALAKDMGAEYRISVSLIYRNDGDDGPMNYFVKNKETIKEILKASDDNFYSFDRSMGEGIYQNERLCGAGVTSISIAPDGSVYPCVSLKNLLGSVLVDSIEVIWSGESRRDFLSELKWANTHECSSCSARQVCLHCAGLSQAETGDMLSCNTCDRYVSECLLELAQGEWI